MGIVRALLDSLLDRVSKLIDQAARDGDNVVARAGGQVSDLLEKIKTAYKAVLNQSVESLDSSIQLTLQDVRKVVYLVDDRTRRNIDHLSNKIAAIVLTLPFANRTPQIESLSPCFIINEGPPTQGVTLYLSGLFPSQNPLLPTLSFNGHVLQPRTSTLSELTFVATNNQLFPAHFPSQVPSAKPPAASPPSQPSILNSLWNGAKDVAKALVVGPAAPIGPQQLSGNAPLQTYPMRHGGELPSAGGRVDMLFGNNITRPVSVSLLPATPGKVVVKYRIRKIRTETKEWTSEIYDQSSCSDGGNKDKEQDYSWVPDNTPYKSSENWKIDHASVKFNVNEFKSGLAVDKLYRQTFNRNDLVTYRVSTGYHSGFNWLIFGNATADKISFFVTMNLIREVEVEHQKERVNSLKDLKWGSSTEVLHKDNVRSWRVLYYPPINVNGELRKEPIEYTSINERHSFIEIDRIRTGITTTIFVRSVDPANLEKI